MKKRILSKTIDIGKNKKEHDELSRSEEDDLKRVT